MVDVAERNLLLALMRRVRRRWRWAAAMEGGALALTVAAVGMAGVLMVLRRSVNPTTVAFDDGITAGRHLPGLWMAGVLILIWALGAATRAVRAISLDFCARAVDRAVVAVSGIEGRAPRTLPVDDVVLAAVDLLTTPAAAAESTLPFVRALTGEALSRARAVPPSRAIRGPRWWLLMMAPAALCILVVSSRASKSRPGADLSRPGGAGAMGAREDGPPRVRMATAAVEAERDDAANAIRAAEKNGDVELSRLAREFQRLMSALMGPAGLDPPVAVARLDALTKAAAAAAALAKAAQAADRAARNALGSADARTDGALAATPVVGPWGGEGTTGSRDDGAGARRLRQGEQGEQDEQDGNEARDAGKQTTAAGPGSAAGDQRRHLEQLQRDLRAQVTNCRKGPVACRTGAGTAERALSELHREAATADARQRLAEAVQQLAERIRRGGSQAENGSEALRRFARAADGAGGPTGASDGAGEPGSSDDKRNALASAEEEQTSERSQGETEVDAPGGGRAPGGAAAAGPGIGTEPGGPALGPRAPAPGPSAGRDMPVNVPSTAGGPSRAQIIGGASSGGFATMGYRRVFDDYRAAVEESLDATSVTGERRYLVRRYFQLIRPRSPP